MRLLVASFPSSISFNSAGEREKKAISDAEAKAEKNNKTAATTMAMMAPVDGCVIVISFNTADSWDKNESESKEFSFG